LISAGICVKIYGTGWDMKNVSPLYRFNTIVPVHGRRYYECLREGKINLAFLSELNEDVYTRRNFEIPGMGGLMLSERTNELLSFFEEGKEAFYFNTKDELLNAVKFILTKSEIQDKVRHAAKIKSYNSGYDLDSRVKKLISELTTIYEENKYSHLV
ncbi:MAG: glycosyltransferase, partial [Sphaerospermopsis kisseleviana]